LRVINGKIELHFQCETVLMVSVSEMAMKFILFFMCFYIHVSVLANPSPDYISHEASSLNNEKTLHVALELFPPWIMADETGSVDELLKIIDRSPSYKIKTRYTTYARAKQLLLSDQVDIFAVGNKNHESPTFLNKVVTIDLGVESFVDYYSQSKQKLNNINDVGSYPIGVTLGGIELAAKMSGLPKERFFEIISIESLVKMLKAGRIHVFIAERNHAINAIKRFDLKNIYYKKASEIPLDFVFYVKNNNKGEMIKHDFEKLFNTLDVDSIFHEKFQYLSLPDKGQVNLHPVQPHI